MTETTEQMPTDEPPSAPEPLFVRPREGRMVGGVCAGIAARWNIDVTLVRVVAVVLAVVTGVGVLAYVAAWLLTPSVDGPARLRPGTMGTFGRRGSRLPMLVLIVLVGLALAALAHALWWGAPTGLLLVAILVALVVGTRRGRWLLVSVAALVAVALGATAAFGSHFGTRTFHVASVDDLHDQYDFGVGTVHLDLAALTLTDDRKTEVHLGRGDVDVTVPANTTVLVHARAGIGSVTVDGHEVSGIDAEQTQSMGSGAGYGQNQLVLDIVVGVGSVDVRTG